MAIVVGRTVTALDSKPNVTGTRMYVDHLPKLAGELYVGVLF